MKKQTYTLVFFCIQLAGCAVSFQKPETTQAEHDADFAYCDQLAFQSQQPKAQYGVTGGWVTRSGNYAHYTPPVITKTDGNAQARWSARKVCMETRGYELK